MISLFCSNCGRNCQSKQLIPICFVCEEQHFLEDSDSHFYTYKRKDGLKIVERKSEIIRKIGQRRLSDDLIILEDGQQSPIEKHPSFRALFLKNSAESQKISSRRQNKKDNISLIKSSKRKALLTAIVIGIIGIVIVKFTFEKELFVVEYDPFVEQDPTLPKIPPTLIDNIVANATQQISNQVDYDTILSSDETTDLQALIASLASDLKDHPYQGNKLLYYIQAQIQFQPTTNPHWSTWYRWILNLSIEKALATRIKAMLFFRYGDREQLDPILNQCSNDGFCQAIASFFDAEHPLPEQTADGYTWRLAMERAIYSQQRHQYGDIGRAIKRLSPDSQWGHALLADDAFNRGDYASAHLHIERARKIDPTDTAFQLWSLRSLLLQGRTDYNGAFSDLNRSDEILLEGAGLLLASGKFSEAIAFTADISNSQYEDRAALLTAHAYVHLGKNMLATSELMKINDKFESPLYRLYQGTLWAMIGDLGGAASIMEDFPLEFPHKWILNARIAINSKNLPLFEQSLDRLAVLDVQLLSIRDWTNIWVPQMDRSLLLKQGEELLQKSHNKEKYTTMLQWISRPTSSRIFIPLSTSDPSVQAMYAQALLIEDNGTLALQKIQRASSLTPNELSLLILKQVVNASIGRKGIAKRELNLLAQKEHSYAFTRWFSEGLLLANDPESSEVHHRKIYTPYPNRMSTSEYKLQWKDTP